MDRQSAVKQLLGTRYQRCSTFRCGLCAGSVRLGCRRHRSEWVSANTTGSILKINSSDGSYSSYTGGGLGLSMVKERSGPPAIKTTSASSRKRELPCHLQADLLEAVLLIRKALPLPPTRLFPTRTKHKMGVRFRIQMTSEGAKYRGVP